MVHIFDRIIVIGVTSSLNTSTTLANLFLMFRFRVAACRRITKEEMKLLVVVDRQVNHLAVYQFEVNPLPLRQTSDFP